MSAVPLPAGFVTVTVGRTTAVVRTEHQRDAEVMLADGSLFEAAARDLAARRMIGRGVAYAIELPVTRTRAVVRHNRHGGLLAPLSRDLFLPPTRAPLELETSLRLAAAGVRTPAVLMYSVRPAALAFRRADLATREIEGGRDLSAYLMPDVAPASREEAWRAVRSLVRTLDAVGARHHDLNVKNILLAHGESGMEAWVLDVDRVVFGEPGSPEVHDGNQARLLRSGRKWRDRFGAVFEESDVSGGIR